jgi:hypothetical protein
MLIRPYTPAGLPALHAPYSTVTPSGLTRPPPHQNVPVMRTIVVLLLSVAALSACGLRGDLVRPVPLWGNPPNEGPTDPRTIKAVEEAAAAEKARQDAERKAADEQRRKELEQQVQPPATQPASPK